ncbi:DUF2914 domain-containing protein [Halobacteriovorax sp. JY17]|uniref:DUF2914 domain-containing protein n=1 Tax=Halobacteriovorax sp. JY17 TaxID=2014617 RepID=UPI000C5E39C1|nr:DUF2914 domain-containing protein [Halobacteriovorax sp. JY17]PIK15385.1 MAG: hypothetical protein CES88_01325 [Halobacteriovorax sp. JY17]
MKFIQKSKDFHQKYPNLLIAIFFISGFLFDVATLGQVDEFGNFLGHTIYLSLLILSYVYLEKEYKKSWLQKFSEYQRDIFHFLAGGLLSGFAIFFFKSSSLSSSGIFIVIVLLILLANESPLFQARGSLIKLTLVQFCISAYFIIYIPVLIGFIGSFIFFLTITLAAITLPILLQRLKHPATNESKIISAAMSVFLIIGYFTNILPPVPLSVKEIGVYHKIVKLENSYNLYSESSFTNFFGFSDTSFKAQPGDSVYVFARVFAPKGLSEKLYIQWEKWDKIWKISDRIPLSIQGGNTWGYRAYAYKKNYTNGFWRAKVMSSDNREIGRVDFSISSVPEKKREWTIDVKD